MADTEEEEYQRCKKQRQTTLNSVVVAVSGTIAAAVLDLNDKVNAYHEDRDKPDHRTLPRGQRRVFRHDQALMCIVRDYTGPAVLFPDHQFVRQFRIEPQRFQRLFMDVGRSGIPYYINRVDAKGQDGASMEARLLLPLKTIAYGVPSYCFQDYFQMSETMCETCMDQFDAMLTQLYKEEYLRCPTEEDVKSIVRLHKAIHKIDGMLGSLDCMHTAWKNCPVAWQGSFKGAKKIPTLVLEAACDYHMWFWHAAYGFAGTLNDKTILMLSPLLEKMINGTFVDLERPLIPFRIANGEFVRLFLLVDGIYPPWSRFVKGIKEPIFHSEKKYSQWQESARKDIERAFGQLQGKFQFMTRPIMMMEMEKIKNRVNSCLILHNMCTSDRVMGDVYARYDPGFSVARREEEEPEILQPRDLTEVQGTDKGLRAVIGINEGDVLTAAQKATITRRYLSSDLRDKEEHVRLMAAITSQKVNEANARDSRFS